MNRLTITTALVVAAMTTAAVQAVTDQDPFYQILDTWQDNFKANFCITAPQDLYGWKLKLKFKQPVSNIQISRVKILGKNADLSLWRFSDQGYNAKWLEGERNCFDFIGNHPGLTTGVKAKVAFIALPEDEACPAQAQGQQFSLDITNHWPNGIGGEFCLRVPRTFNGNWKLRVEFNQKGITGLQVYEAQVRNLYKKMDWMLTPMSYNGDLEEGSNFCLRFLATCRKWMMPCIRAFFTEDDEVTPIEVTLPSTTQGPVTQSPTTQSPTTQSPTTQSPTTQSPTTQSPTTQSPTTQTPTTQPPTTQPPTTQSPTTQSPTTQSPTTQPPTTQPPTTQSPTTQSPTTQSPTTQSPTTPSSSNARYDYKEALSNSLMFYLAQRSGALPDDIISWRKDSAVDDGIPGRDLSGGWYDAGDYLKLNFPMAGSTTALLWGLIKFQDGYTAAGQLQRMRDVAKWPLDYFLKCWDAQNEILYGQVGNVKLDHDYWGRPEDMTMSRPVYKLTTSAPGSDLAGETAAAFAAGYLAFSGTDSSYASQLLQAARSVYDFADANRGYYHQSIPDAASVYRSWGYQDELCWGAAWLYKATGETTYLNKAKQAANNGPLSTTEFSWDDKGMGCVVLLYEMETDASQKQRYANAINAFTAKWRNGNGMTVTPCGLSWLRQWGSLRYAMNAAMIAVMAAEAGLEAEANRKWALSQVNFALGDNKNGRSYVVGFGVNPPVQPHHASSSCPLAPATCDWNNFNAAGPNPHVLYGALVGGPAANGDYTDSRQDYVMNEVACDYNAGFQTVLAGLVSLQSRGALPEADPKCPQPRASTAGPAPSPTTPSATSSPGSTSAPGTASPPDMTDNINQDMLDLYTNVYPGDGTYYGEGRSGTCTYDTNNFPQVGLSSHIDALAALNQIKFFNSKSCGMCFRVTGNGVGAGNDPIVGEHIVFVKDLCPNGACQHPGSVDFAQNGDGRWEIEIQAVQCPVGNNKLQYSFQGSNPWYIKLQVSNYRIPPNEVSIQRDGVWQSLSKTSDGYWFLNDGIQMHSTSSIPVRVTAINGEQLTDSIPQLANGQVMNGQHNVQFSLDPSLPTV